jgi:DNA-binding response OmpR family regulator
MPGVEGVTMAASVLLADPEREAAAFTTSLLGDQGFAVTAASTGEEVLSLAVVFDIVLLERLLPDMDGVALCRLLRSRSLVPIIFVSRQADELSRVVGLEVGADD